MSLYHIIKLKAIKMIKNTKWRIPSVVPFMNFFPKTFSIVEFIKINRNLHQSRAGIGSKLNTHKLIEIIAQNMAKNIIQALRELVIKSTIPIGQLTACIASCLSFGVWGLNIFFKIYQIHLNVSNISFFVSIKAYFAESKGQYLYLKSLFISIFGIK
jgi:hypothetical protein